MNTTLKSTLKTLAFSLVLAATIQSAQAAIIGHTYVAGTGSSDGNPCTRSLPCATFAGALAKTLPFGVISVVSAGDFGPVGIGAGQSVTIDGTGSQASIVMTSSGDAITISGGSGDTVVLIHLSLTRLPNSGADNGIVLIGSNLEVDDCKISGFPNDGLIVQGSTGRVVVENTTFARCANGIANFGSGPMSLRNVTLEGNSNGLIAQSTGATDISHSLIAQNGGDGLFAYGCALSVLNCIVTNNGTAVYADNGSVIRLTNNDIFSNTTGIATNGNTPGIVSTAQNNHKAGSLTPGAPTPGKVIVTQ